MSSSTASFTNGQIPAMPLSSCCRRTSVGRACRRWFRQAQNSSGSDGTMIRMTTASRPSPFPSRSAISRSSALHIPSRSSPEAERNVAGRARQRRRSLASSKSRRRSAAGGTGYDEETAPIGGPTASSEGNPTLSRRWLRAWYIALRIPADVESREAGGDDRLVSPELRGPGRENTL